MQSQIFGWNFRKMTLPLIFHPGSRAGALANASETGNGNLFVTLVSFLSRRKIRQRKLKKKWKSKKKVEEKMG